MNTNERLIQDFYTAFQAHDGEKMAAFYRPDAVFSDPAFGSLRGPEIGGMWRMLCARGHDLKITFERVHADGEAGAAHWEAWYTFSSTGRKVHNVIQASFLFRDGGISEHHDHFNFWRWASMALGPAGLLLGWTPLVRNRVRAAARRGLEVFMKKNPTKT
jgi:ketosteroid isomerase-like protein